MKARCELGFSANVSLRDGLAQAIDWTRRHSPLIERCMARHAGFMRAPEPGQTIHQPS